MSHWRWYDGPVKGNCAGCGRHLYEQRDSGLVEYANKHWHVGCVLDLLPKPVPAQSDIYTSIYGTASP